MARIFYSMAGEGRGHATRVRALVEELRRKNVTQVDVMLRPEIVLVQDKLSPLVLHVTTNGFLTERIIRFCEERKKSVPLMLLVSAASVVRGSLARAKEQRDWVHRCPGCWAECEVLPSAMYSGDLLGEFFRGKVVPLTLTRDERPVCLSSSR